MIPILLQIIAVPLITSAFIFFARYKIAWKAGWLASIALLYTIALHFIAGIRVYQGEIIYEAYPFAPEVSMDLLYDGLSLPVGLIINLLCAALAFYSIHYVEHRIDVLYPEADERTRILYYTRFYFMFLLFPAAFFGVSLSTNLIQIFLFTELLTIPLYFIMGYFGYVERFRVALMCFLWAAFCAVCVLTGIVLTYSQIGTFEIAELSALSGNRFLTLIVSLIFLGFATKLAIFPLHVWMPWVHAEHPTCIAGLLAVYANIALYVLVRIIFLPLHADLDAFRIPIMILALITMVYGSLLTLAQTDVKRIAACSTVSQISYTVLGVAALTTWSVEGGMFLFLAHIMAKTVFFSTAGILVYITGTRNINEMGGLVARMPVTCMLWAFGCLMLSGLPPFANFSAKWIMFTGIFMYGAYGPSIVLVVAIMGIFAIILTFSYTFWSLKRIFFGPLNPKLANNDKIKDPPLTMSVPLLLIAVVSFLIGVYPKIIMDLFHSVIGGVI
ncbi:MAG: NADH-quinone oxidoreductase subunit M [Methanophagales archaeon]|nr:NADH-quinone oxidoreductase subunit M [Methanophagales archaeon]